jgi:hypothetical protein
MADAKYAVSSGGCKSKIKYESFVGFRIDTNKDCLTNSLDGRDVEDRFGHCHLRVISCDMDRAVRPPDPPLVGV